MHKTLSTIAIIILLTLNLAACGSAPTPAPTQTLPTLEPDTPTLAPSRTPIPPPTRRPSQTSAPTDIDPAYETKWAPFRSCAYLDEHLFSPKGIWYVCQPTSEFTIISRDGTSWKFSPRDQLGIKDSGYAQLFEWTPDEKFMYFSVMHSADGDGEPFTANAEAVLRMDLSNGKVTTVLGDLTAYNFYAYSISRTSHHLAYAGNGKGSLHLLDLQNGGEKVIPIESEYTQVGEFTWSDDERLLAYKMYTEKEDCKFSYSIRLLNLENLDAVTFIKNETIDQCNLPFPEFNIWDVSADQVTLIKEDQRWEYNIKSQRLKLQGSVAPSP